MREEREAGKCVNMKVKLIGIIKEPITRWLKTVHVALQHH